MSRPRTLRQAVPGLRRTYAHLRPQIRRERPLLAGGAAASLAEVVFRLAEPWPIKFVVDTVVAPADGVAGRYGTTTVIAVAAVAAVAVAGLRALSSYLATLALALAGNRVLIAVREQAYRHLLRLDLGYHARARAGDLVNRLVGDVGRLQEVAVTAALPLVVNVVTFVGMLGVMLVLDWRLALVVVATIPLFALTSARLTRRIREHSRTQRSLEGRLSGDASESLAAVKLVQAYSLEEELGDRFAADGRRDLAAGVKGKRMAAALERRTDLVVGLATGLVLVLGARLALSGAITPGELVVFLTYLRSAFKPMRDFAKYTGRIAKAAASGERIVEVLDAEPAVTDPASPVPLHRARGRLLLDRVSLDWEPGRPALRRVSLRVPPGTRVGVLGESGAGKSSLVALLLRLVDPTSGRILLDGVDLRRLSRQDLRRQVAVVLQDSVLFAGTVRDNVRHGSPQATDAQVWEALSLAGAADFVRALPEGLDTPLAERGASLSGGQRQRIAVARAAVRDAPIVLLDEATTGLDRDTAKGVLEALRRLTEGRTTITISHDLEQLADADLVVVLERGRVVRSGPPADVLRPRALPQPGTARLTGGAGAQAGRAAGRTDGAAAPARGRRRRLPAAGG